MIEPVSTAVYKKMLKPISLKLTVTLKVIVLKLQISL